MAWYQEQKRGNRITFTVRDGTQSISKTFEKARDGEKWARSVVVAMDNGTFRKEDFSERHRKKVEAEQAEQEQKRILEAKSNTPTLSEALDFYLTLIEKTASYETERKRAAKWKARPCGQKLITEFNIRDVISVRDAMEALGRKPSTIHNEFTCVSNVYRYAFGELSRMREKWPGIPVNIENPVSAVRKSYVSDISAGIPRPSPNDYRKKRISPDMEQAIHAEFLKRDVELAAAWKIAINTGMRINEILKVERRWIYLDEGIIEIPPGKTKNKQPRTVALNQVAADALKCVLEASKPEFRGRKRTRYMDKNHLFSITYAIMYDNFSRIRKKLAESDHRFEDLRIHDCKHEAASRMLAAGLSVPEVMEQIGNTRLESARRYMNPTVEERKKKIMKM